MHIKPTNGILPPNPNNQPKSGNHNNLTKWVKDNIVKWRGDPSNAIPDPRPPPKPSKPPQGGVDKLSSDVGRKVEAKLADGDVRGAIRLLTSEDTIAPNDC